MTLCILLLLLCWHQALCNPRDPSSLTEGYDEEWRQLSVASIKQLTSGHSIKVDALGAKIAHAQRNNLQAAVLQQVLKAVEEAPVLEVDLSRSSNEYLYAWNRKTSSKYKLSRVDLLRQAAGSEFSLSEIKRLRRSKVKSKLRTVGIGNSVTNCGLNAGLTGRCFRAVEVGDWSQAQQSWRAVFNYSYIVRAQRVPDLAGSDTFRMIAIVPASPLARFRQTFFEFWQYSWYGNFLQGLSTLERTSVGYQVVRFDFTSDDGQFQWISGTGETGNNDGFSVCTNNLACQQFVTARSTGIIPLGLESDATYNMSLQLDATHWTNAATAWYPSCTEFEFLTSGSQCTVANARPEFYVNTQWLYIADSGNCAVRQVDLSTGNTITKWGQAGCAHALGSNESAGYPWDSRVAQQVSVGRSLDLAWAGSAFLLVLDKDANRLRKFVTAQHQGLSNLAGNKDRYDTCGANTSQAGEIAGADAVFCGLEAMAVDAAGKVAVVSDWNAAQARRRLRVLRFIYTYSDGGDVADVNCTVRTIEMVLGANYSGVLFTAFGGMAFSPDARYVFAGSANRVSLDTAWFISSMPVINEPSSTSNPVISAHPQLPLEGNIGVVAVDLTTGQVIVLRNDKGCPLSGMTVIDAVASAVCSGCVQLMMAQPYYVWAADPKIDTAYDYNLPTFNFLSLLVNTSNSSACAGGGSSSRRRADAPPGAPEQGSAVRGEGTKVDAPAGGEGLPGESAAAAEAHVPAAAATASAAPAGGGTSAGGASAIGAGGGTAGAGGGDVLEAGAGGSGGVSGAEEGWNGMAVEVEEGAADGAARLVGIFDSEGRLRLLDLANVPGIEELV